MSRDEIAALIARRRTPGIGSTPRRLRRITVTMRWWRARWREGRRQGREAIEKLYVTYFRAFTDFKLEREPVDRRRQRGGARDAHRHRQWRLHGHGADAPEDYVPLRFLYVVRDGLIARERRIYDFTGLLIQVGTLKAKPV